MSELYQFLSDNSLFVVLIVVLIIWLGIGLYLMKIDSKLSRIEKSIELEGDKNE